MIKLRIPVYEKTQIPFWDNEGHLTSMEARNIRSSTEREILVNDPDTYFGYQRFTEGNYLDRILKLEIGELEEFTWAIEMYFKLTGDKFFPFPISPAITDKGLVSSETVNRLEHLAPAISKYDLHFSLLFQGVVAGVIKNYRIGILTGLGD